VERKHRAIADVVICKTETVMSGNQYSLLCAILLKVVLYSTYKYEGTFHWKFSDSIQFLKKTALHHIPIHSCPWRQCTLT